MNNAPRPPQFPDPNRLPVPPAGFEPSAGEASAHILEQHGTEMMRPPAAQQTPRPIEQQGPPTERIYPHSRESYDPVSPIRRTALALASLKMGESAVVWMPGKGNARMTLAGRDPRDNPVYREELITAPTPSSAPPATARREALLPPPVFGPKGGAGFGPQGTQYEAPERELAVTGGSQPLEAHPDVGPDFVDINRDLTDDEESRVYDNPLRSSREGKFRREEAGPAAPTVEQPVADIKAPPLENVTPETVQTGLDRTAEVGKDLVDQLAAGTAPPVAEMPLEYRPDMTAVKQRVGAAAAAARAKETEIPKDEEAPDIQGVGGNIPPDDNQEADITQILPEGVVPEGERPPDTDFMPGGGPRHLYRR
jgi:hypothetical protein